MPTPAASEFFTLETLLKERYDVAIVGTSHAAIPVVERLYDQYPDITIVLIERGQKRLTTHVRNVLPGPFDRAQWIEAYGAHPWTGDFQKAGMLLLDYGGRSTVSGSHFPRFYAPDYTLWPEGQWPIPATALDDYYAAAEIERHVSPAPCDPAIQVWLQGALNAFNLQLPRWGVDNAGYNSDGVSRGYYSAVTSLSRRVENDCIHSVCNPGTKRRIAVVLSAYCTGIKYQNGSRVMALVCRDTQTGRLAHIEAKVYVLAASPIESARLILNSGLATGLPATGRYLSEHAYLESEVSVPMPRNIRNCYGQPVNLIIPPLGIALEQRFQVEICGSVDPGQCDRLKLRMTGIAAVDPCPRNRVAVSLEHDAFGIPKAHTIFALSQGDQQRIEAMRATLVQIASLLRGTFTKSPVLLAPGRSHHESGVLRMGDDPRYCVTDAYGRVLTTQNLYVVDASVFPVNGVANPTLTVAALGYRLADHICQSHLKAVPKELPNQPCRPVRRVAGTSVAAKNPGCAVEQESTYIQPSAQHT